MVQAIYRTIAQADGSCCLQGAALARSLVSDRAAGFFDEMARKISQSRSGSPEKRGEDLTAGAGWLLSTDDGLEDAR
jgi:hypothetical protein